MGGRQSTASNDTDTDTDTTPAQVEGLDGNRLSFAFPNATQISTLASLQSPHPTALHSAALRKVLALLLDGVLHPQQDRRLPLVQLAHLIVHEQVVGKLLGVAGLDGLEEILGQCQNACMYINGDSGNLPLEADARASARSRGLARDMSRAPGWFQPGPRLLAASEIVSWPTNPSGQMAEARLL
jgi:hypothetical protein